MPDIRVRYIVDDSQLLKTEQTFSSLSEEEQEQVNNFKKINSEAQKAGQSIDKAGKQGKDSIGGLDKTLKSVGGSIAAYFTVTALLDFGKQVLAVTSQFQKFQAVLTNTLGSEVAAKVAMQQISEFAAKTNFSVTELTESYVKLVNRGFKPTTEDLRKLGDLANSTGKSFDQLTEALLDSFTGENERLKEFGITAKKTGDTTQFTFKGVTTEVKNTTSAVKNYILSLGDLQGVSGSTEKISATLDGQISNLGDSFDRLKVTIGNQGAGIFSNFIQGAGFALDAINNLIKSQDQLNEEIYLTRFGQAGEFVKKELKSIAAEYVKTGLTQQQASDAALTKLERNLEIEIMGRRAQVANATALIKGEIDENRILTDDEKEIQLARVKNGEEEIKVRQEQLRLVKELINPAEKETEVVRKTAAELKKEEAARKKANDELERRRKLGQEYLKALQDEAEELSLSALKAKEDAEKAADEKQKNLIERMKKEGKDIQELADAQLAEREKREKEHQQVLNQIREEATNLAVEIGNGLFELAAQKRQAESTDIEKKRTQELKRVGDDKQAQSFINAKFDRQEAAIKTRQAKADKDQALFNIAIQTAQKIIQVYPNPVLIALAAATGAVEAALVAARPIPKFWQGTEHVEGPGTSTSDSILARLSVGERVVPEAINRQLAGIPNMELPKIVAMGYEAMMQKANVNGTYATNELHEEIKGLRKDLKKMPISSISMDEKGFRKFVFQGDSVTHVLNNQFNR